MSFLRGVLDAWQQNIGKPQQVAALFTEDAIFQGLKPYVTGRQGVADYYAGQPAGLTVEYRINEVRLLAEDVELGWVEATFRFADGRPPVEVNLTMVVTGGLISHYHVSPRL
ncbi:uncharacterized protein (TIGR02246 family) [Actinoplanes lutulentus]|uniref:Uncharacterized protein (TIGR02246 family) n=1 Tax=Actinoplanes lutulentus TaxID=1287878 RepID=A0A327ZAF6_9ACTN|nr:hypothetical protein [Actinoplanes lutulentus]MBB2949147.1 uncharacterized protein (TIGR02246 family) [Actinoplanes lutulentus]RAK31468.1 uncharacterized protein (TIGR02246 family) [Actinoplanes lutulentus]